MRAEWTFKHQRVYDNINKKLNPLTPFEDDVAEHVQTSFVGPHIEDSIAINISQGLMCPISKTVFEFPNNNNNNNNRKIDFNNSNKKIYNKKVIMHSNDNNKKKLNSFFTCKNNNNNNNNNNNHNNKINTTMILKQAIFSHKRPK